MLGCLALEPESNPAMFVVKSFPGSTSPTQFAVVLKLALAVLPPIPIHHDGGPGRPA